LPPGSLQHSSDPLAGFNREEKGKDGEGTGRRKREGRISGREGRGKVKGREESRVTPPHLSSASGNELYRRGPAVAKTLMCCVNVKQHSVSYRSPDIGVFARLATGKGIYTNVVNTDGDGRISLAGKQRLFVCESSVFTCEWGNVLLLL